MRLLHVIHTLNPASGGTAEAVRNLVAHPGDSVQSVLSLDHSSDPWTKGLRCSVHCVGPGTGKYGYTRQVTHWLRGNLRVCDAAIIHGCWQYHGIATSAECQKAGIPYFVFPHGMLDPYFSRASRVKHVKKLAYWPLERSVLERARSVLFTSTEECERAHEGFRFKSEDEIVPLGINAPTHDPIAARNELLKRYPQLAGKRVLLYLGRLHPKKGVDLLIRAFRNVVQSASARQSDTAALHLLIVGPADGDAYLRELTRMAVPVSGHVTFTGMLAGNLKAGALALAEALALPSHQENFGFSVIEALACGRPVLLSDQVNIWREILADGAGIVASDTRPGIVSLLQKWVARRPRLLRITFSRGNRFRKFPFSSSSLSNRVA
jgi:glycosyltransferase involved in cell wall biosynthesis